VASNDGQLKAKVPDGLDFAFQNGKQFNQTNHTNKQLKSSMKDQATGAPSLGRASFHLDDKDNESRYADMKSFNKLQNQT